MRKRNVVIGCSAVLASFVLLTGLACWIIYKRWVAPLREVLSNLPQMPAELNDPRIVVGAGFMSKSLFLHSDMLAG
jgi:hypothetical protein